MTIFDSPLIKNRRRAKPNVPHHYLLCPGVEAGCTFHPLATRQINDALYAFSTGWDWADIFQEDLDEMERRDNAPAALAAAARKEAEAEAAALAYQQQVIAERNAIRVHASCNKKGAVEIKKIQQPCKKLYSCEGGGAAGGVARPTTKCISSECWAHEYTDAKTGKKIVKHVCQWLHPGEAGWLPQWNTDRTYRPDLVAEGLGKMRGVAPPPPAAAKKPAAPAPAPKPQNRNPWAALSSGHDSAW
jgi:hypothetical protein